MTFSSYLIEPSELSSALSESSGEKRIIPLCASWFLPNDPKGRIGSQVYAEAHIPGALFIDIDVVKGDSPYPHMLPTAVDFAKAMQNLGIKSTDTIVVYDTKELGIFSAPRVAWMFKIFGHENTHVLNNFKVWVDEGYPIESGHPDMHGEQREISQYPIPVLEKSRVVDFEQMKVVVLDSCKSTQVLDARPHGRWLGTSPEPRPGLSNGHMPGSLSIPFSDVLDPETKQVLGQDKLREYFAKKGVDRDQPVISSCGTGVTAAVVDLAIQEAFGDGPSGMRRIYDGSWTEWAQRATAEQGLIVKSGNDHEVE